MKGNIQLMKNGVIVLNINIFFDPKYGFTNTDIDKISLIIRQIIEGSKHGTIKYEIDGDIYRWEYTSEG